MGLQPLRRRLRREVDRLGPGPVGPFTVPVGQDRLQASWSGPADPMGVLLVSHAGDRGGTAVQLQPFGVDPRDLAAQGIAVITWDRRGTGRSPAAVDLSPGALAAVEDFQAVFDQVASRVEPGTPFGVLSWSSGILPALRAGRDLAFLLDGEAPADRWSLLPPQLPSSPDIGRMAAWSLQEDAPWAGREPLPLLSRIRCPYHRLQAELDHVHGRFDLHARRMVEEARRVLPQALCNGGTDVRPLAGRLHAHGATIRQWILDAFLPEE